MILVLMVGLGGLWGQKGMVTRLAEEYINEWKQFYPSRAYQQGFLEAIFHFENYSLPNIQAWTQINKDTLFEINRLDDDQPLDHQINGRLLRIYLQREIHHWEETAPHLYLLEFYIQPIANTFRRLENTLLLNPGQKTRVIKKGLIFIQGLCRAADKMIGQTIIQIYVK